MHDEAGAAPRPPTLTVMTANLGNGIAADDRVLDAIRRSGAELIGLQELNRIQAAALDRELNDLYPYRWYFGDSYEGKGILSRLPIVEAWQLDLARERPDCAATVVFDGLAITLIVAHPRPPRLRRAGIVFDQDAQRHIVRLAHLARDRAPAIMVGDFNMTPRHPAYRRYVQLGLHDAFTDAGLRRNGATFPMRLGRRRLTPPMVRFDYVWHTGDFATDACWVGPDTGSDHLPVLARVHFTATRQE